MLIHVVGLLVVLVAVGVTAFLRGYDSYNDNVLYAERLSQMQEFTEQLFAGLEDVVKGQWQTAKYQYNHLLYNQPGTTDELLALMAKQAELNEMGPAQTHLIAVDDRGCYYTQYGKQGSLAEMDALLNSPDRVRFVSNSMAADQTQMMFLYRLEQPLTILDDGQPVRLIYYGIARDMEELNPYFNCEAYDGNNSVYVVDAQGFKLFSSSGKNYDCVRDAVEGKPVSLHAVPKFEDALAALRQSPCDAVLLPWNEPELSEKVRQVRVLAQPDTILLAVASDHHDVPDHLAETGLDDFLPLPFFLSNLEDEMERVRAARLTTSAAEDVSPLAGLKFLCAEDNELNAEILQALLEMKGASCNIYSNGRELVNAFASIQPEKYDVILTDVMMPVMDGLEAARCIRTSPNPLGRRIPIIAMTANAFTEDIQKSRDAGMDAHLSKPINIDALEQTVRKLRVVSRNK